MLSNITGKCLSISLVIILFHASACNIFEPFNEIERSNDISGLIADAQVALLNNDPAEAIDLLEQALTVNPDHVGVRIVLSTAILQQEGIQFTLLQEIAAYLKSPPVDLGPLSTATTQSYCTFDTGGAALPRIYFDDVPAFRRLEIAENPLRRVHFLLDVPLTTDSTPDFELLAQGLMTRSATTLGIALISIHKMAVFARTNWYYRGEDSIGFCADDAENLLAMTQFIACDQAHQLDMAIEDLRTRSALLNAGAGSRNTQTIAIFRDTRLALLSTVDASCTL